MPARADSNTDGRTSAGNVLFPGDYQPAVQAESGEQHGPTNTRVDQRGED